MFKKFVLILLILSGSSSLYASNSGESVGSSFGEDNSSTGKLFGSSLEQVAPDQNRGKMIIYPHLGLSLSFYDYTAWSGRDVGLYVAGDPDLYMDPYLNDQLSGSLGVMVDYFLTERLAVTYGLIYEYTPFCLVYEGADPLEFKINFNFLTIPVGVHYYFQKLIVAGGGFYFGKIIYDDAKVSGNGTSDPVDISAKNDFGIFADLGVNFNISERYSFMAFIRGKWGLIKLYDEPDIVTDIKLRVLTLNVAWGVRI